MAGPALSGEGANLLGSPLVPVIVPIVTIICLAVPIVMVFYADSHPRWKHRRPAQGPGHRTRG